MKTEGRTCRLHALALSALYDEPGRRTVLNCTPTLRGEPRARRLARAKRVRLTRGLASSRRVPAEWCFWSGDDMPRVQKTCVARGDEHRCWFGDLRPNRHADMSGILSHASRHLAFDHAVPAPRAGAAHRTTARASIATHTRRLRP